MIINIIILNIKNQYMASFTFGRGPQKDLMTTHIYSTGLISETIQRQPLKINSWGDADNKQVLR